jgi:carbon-monoxide dehydrogenase medium subunit
VQPEVVIDVNGLPALSGLRYAKGQGLSIGAAAKIEEIEKSELIREKYHALYQAAREIGSPQIRAMASIGGNCCNASPCADTPPALVVFGAGVTLVGPQGRRGMPLEAFIQGNRKTAIAADEYLERIDLPEPWPNSASRFANIGLRAAQEIDIASLAVNLALEPKSRQVAEVRIAMGAVAAVPLRATGAEGLLKGRELTEARIAAAAASCSEECRPIDDLRASAEYRRYVIQTLAVRLIREAGAAIAA